MKRDPIDDLLKKGIATRLDHPNLWWNTLSNFQKAIRRGNLEHAHLSALLLYNTDRLKLFRRMAVIALEDIAFGNLLLANKALEFALANRFARPLVPIQEELTAALSLVAEMVGSVKDRSPCHLTVAAKRNAKGVERIASLSASRCAAIYGDESADLQLRCIAGRSITGTLIVNYKRVGETDRKAFLRALEKLGYPDRITGIAVGGAKLGGESASLAVNVPVIYGPLREDTKRCQSNELPTAELIRGLLSTAYDQHNLEGKWAIASYAKQSERMRRFLIAHGVDAKKIIGNLVFMTEGAVVDRWVNSPLTRELKDRNEWAQCFSANLPHAALPEAKAILMDELQMLNLRRRQIAEATSFFDAGNAERRQGALF